MQRIITYDLRNRAANSNEYYKEIASFADNWLAGTLPNVVDLVDGFRMVRERQKKPDRSPACCAYELLVFGSYLKVYETEAALITSFWKSLLQNLVKLQEHFPKCESLVKRMRGLFYRLASPLHWGKRPSENRADGLLLWLQATGENTIADRLKEWLDYIRICKIEDATIACVMKLADGYFLAGREVLGKYTTAVDDFLVTYAAKHKYRYDATLINSCRPLYHLSMLGTEILNREYRQRYLDCPRKIVILPPCMRAKPEGECEAIFTQHGGRCSSCTPSCRIHQITKLGEKHGFGVFIIPDELRGLGQGQEGEKMGVTGVSCVLTNWTGGWDMEKFGIPAQGVLLDYVGCQYHWDKKGFPTDINVQQLLKCLDIDT